jgi:hypothetical protein
LAREELGKKRGAQRPTLDRPLPILCMQFWSASRTGQLYVIAWPSVEGTSTALRVEISTIQKNIYANMNISVV